MHVLIIADDNDRSERAVLAWLRREGVGLHVVCAPDGQTHRFCAGEGIPVTPHAFRNRFHPPSVRRLRALLRQHHFDLAHCFCSRGLSNLVLAVRGIPLPIVAYRGAMAHVSPFDPASWFTYLSPRVNRIVCVSQAVSDCLRGMGIPARRLVTIHKGHDVDWYTGHPAPDPGAWGIPPDAFVVSFAGCIRPLKGVGYLAASARYLPADSRVHYLLIGPVRDRRVRACLRDPAIAGRLHNPGYIPDAWRVTGATDLYCMPSIRKEGLPRSAIEAMSQGVPALVTRVGGMPELVVNGECGFIVPPRDARALATAIETLARAPELHRRMGVAARARIREHFPVERTAQKTLALYRELVG